MDDELVLPILIRVVLRVMAMKEYFIFPKDSGLEPVYQMQFSIIPRTLIERVLPICRDAVNVFYSPGQPGGYSMKHSYQIQIIF